MNHRKDLAPRLNELKQAAAGSQGRKFWRSLEELSDLPEFQELMRQEFPQQADVWDQTLNRRKFLGLMGASLALAGLSSCSVRPAPQAEIAPYVKNPREIKPGAPLFFATTMPSSGGAVGLLVENHMGRPTKIEGNPTHPASLGATSIYHQASVLGLYDPDRSQTPTHLGKTRTRKEAMATLRFEFEKLKENQGAGLRILSEPILSPTIAAERERLLDEFPHAGWHVYEPVHRDTKCHAARMAFGEDVNTYYDLTKANVVLSLGSDFLSSGPGHLRYARDFVSRRRVRVSKENASSAKMNQLYVAETTVSPTGAKADHRLALSAQDMERLARKLATELGVLDEAEADVGSLDDRLAHWISVVAHDLKQHRGRSVVIPGVEQSANVHLLAHAINQSLENVGEGKPVIHTNPIHSPSQDCTASLRGLVEDMKSGQVECLVILEANPAYTAPADLEFVQHMQNVPLRFHFGLYQDETARQCHWHVPLAHYLESWGDGRAFDGTTSLIQPLIEPLYGNLSLVEVARFLTTQVDTPGRQIVRDYWRNQWRDAEIEENFHSFWEIALHDGVIKGIREREFAPITPSLKQAWQSNLKRDWEKSHSRTFGDWEIVFQPDPSVYDGSFANNGWLQELPKPLTKLTWDNAALMSPASADRLGLGFGEYAHGGEHGGYDMPVIQLELDGRTVEAPVWIMPGHADNSITVWLGYGRTAAGRVGGERQQTVGFNAYRLRTMEHPWFAGGLKIQAAPRSALLACTQQHHLMEGRDIVRAETLETFQENPDFAIEPLKHQEHAETLRAEKPLTFYDKDEFESDLPLHKWGMAIDLTTCVGCNACIVGCQAENNIPVVGKEQVLMGREMHWLRVDRYISGTMHEPEEFYFQPVPCMHCENAPCEYVCPTEATVHSAEGLNDMIYNRCVGTRFCSNNCPYKVRRFNFLEYSEWDNPTRQMQYNPDVTVRSRGVMEKCTYCVQRIRHAEIGAQREGRPLLDNEVLTACQAACPTNAISFGDLNQKDTTVSKWKESPLNYGLLAHLNTQPRTTYLAALRNANKELEEKGG